MVRWPAVVRPGTVNQELTSSLDWFPTFASLVGFELKPGVVYDGVANAEAIFLGGYHDNETDPSMSARELLVRALPGSFLSFSPSLAGRREAISARIWRPPTVKCLMNRLLLLLL